ncbi:hypothetical protein ABENE_19275 [Asticcacaulis benevestitus DSM 16100 = ATCC BAA-896]|uniref:TonB-dependent receptor plug domain-containing protein n=2 Tax=Asticcacaulis TaxID=76890 RepID=V4PA75_9CAUL|nr:hypothetical protein ABENE_19275 [Asticcacaulis benevestitus DSM 16100 = ATCC BAA-896]
MATTTFCTAVLTAMAAPALLATVAALIPAQALAQDYTSGALIGSVSDSGGAPVSGATVTLTSQGQGQARTMTSSAAGSFSATGLQPGEYNVVVEAPGFDKYETTVSVVISQEVRLEASLQTTGATQTVVVKAKRVRQDFTKTTTGLTVDLDTLTSQQPIARNLTAVTMLAPTVTMGNPGFGEGDNAVASFGGGSVAENAYYIDGLNITNPDTYISSARVPFDFYKTVEVKTGGYAAEFGRATGGVVNATTKSGTNTFMFAVHGNYQPSNFRNEQLDTYDYRGKFSQVQDNSLSVEAGGPIIKDRLFAYGLYQFNDYASTKAGINTGTYTKTKNTDPFLGLKLDGYITPTQHVSLTYFDTTNTDKADQYGFDSDTDTIGAYKSSTKEELGGQNWVLNYAGKVTDWFSISAAVGDMKDRDNLLPSDLTSYNVKYYDLSGTPTTISTTQPNTAINVIDMERKFWRADGDVRFDAWGHHHVRFGIDHEKNSENKTTDLTGGSPVQYRFREYDNTDDNIDNVDEVLLNVIYEHMGGHVSSEAQAIYIQDSWDVTKNLNLQFGLRSDNFKQFNLSGEQYMDLKDNVAPRLGFAWDPTGEGQWKVFGSYGQNFIPPAMNMGFRGKDTYFQQYFNAPTGGWVLDPVTGLPQSVGTPNSKLSTLCPTSSLSGAPGFSGVDVAGNYCTVYGNGEQEGANSKTAEGLKATHVDEVILGTTYRVNDLWTVGVTGTMRSTKNVSEDSDFTDAIIGYLGNATDLTATQRADAIAMYTGTSNYYVWNVGDHSATVRLKKVLTGETEQRVITLSADQLGHFHDAKREYQALTFDFKRAFDGKWGLQGSYTWSRLSGNYSGTVSEYGNTVQQDAGATFAWDSPGMENYSGGLLAGDRTHTFKLWGSYQLTPSFLVGANVILQSPERFSCLGFNADDAYAAGYEAVSHYCGGLPAPQGKGLKSDWTKNIDVSMRYTVPQKYALGGNLVLRADIFNLFDQHSVVTRYVTYDSGYDPDTNTYFKDDNYGTPTFYNTPRYVRVGFDLSY